MKLPSCPRTLIINILRKHPDGLTLTSIAELTGLHRHTATKYVYELKGAGVINERDIGSAKLCYLKEGFSREEQKKLVERLNGNGAKVKMKGSLVTLQQKSSAGQLQIITAFLFLFLIPTGAMIAQNTTHVLTREGDLILDEINTTEVLVEPEPNPENQNETIQGVIPEETNTSVETPENQTFSDQNQIDSNQSGKETVMPDTGIFDNTTSTQPQKLTSETVQKNETVIESQGESAVIPAETIKPEISIEIVSPEKITRGETLEVSTIVSNTGNVEARNVRLFWEIPPGLETISGETEVNCSNIQPDSNCNSTLTLSSTISTETGTSEIKILVNYEE